MGFWLAVHLENIELTNFLVNYDVYLRQLVTLAMKRKPEKPAGYKKPKEDVQRKITRRLSKIDPKNN